LPVDVSVQTIITPEETPAAEATPEPVSGAVATVTVESANCRANPRGGAEKISILYQGQKAEILGRNDDLANPWFYITVPDTKTHCWLWGNTAKANVKVKDLPIIK